MHGVGGQGERKAEGKTGLEGEADDELLFFTTQAAVPRTNTGLGARGGGGTGGYGG